MANTAASEQDDCVQKWSSGLEEDHRETKTAQTLKNKIEEIEGEEDKQEEDVVDSERESGHKRSHLRRRRPNGASDGSEIQQKIKDFVAVASADPQSRQKVRIQGGETRIFAFVFVFFCCVCTRSTRG